MESATLARQVREFVEHSCYLDSGLWESLESLYQAWLAMGNLPVGRFPLATLICATYPRVVCSEIIPGSGEWVSTISV